MNVCNQLGHYTGARRLKTIHLHKINSTFRKKIGGAWSNRIMVTATKGIKSSVRECQYELKFVTRRGRKEHTEHA